MGYRNCRHLQPRNVRRRFHPTSRDRPFTEPFVMCRPQRRPLLLLHNVKERPRQRWSRAMCQPGSSTQALASEQLRCEHQFLDRRESQLLDQPTCGAPSSPSRHHGTRRVGVAAQHRVASRQLVGHRDMAAARRRGAATRRPVPQSRGPRIVQGTS